jgi:predicted nucleic acid-binding Zn ribbon protein
MSKGKKISKKDKRQTRYQRNLRIAIIVISILLVLSMALSLIKF